MEILKPFQFNNSRQIKIYSSLKRFIGDAPASFYRDACKVVSDNCDLETKTHLIGHLMREVFGWIIDIMLPVDYTLTAEEKKESDKNKDSYQRKIKYVTPIFGIDVNHKMVQFWLDHIADNENGLHSWAHRESMESVRPSNKDFNELWDGTELLLDFLLDKIESNYLVYTKQIDQILAKQAIASEDIKKIKKHIPLNQTTMNYFFDRLNHPECMLALEQNDFFKYPKKPLKHENGGVSFPLWPPMTYLVKMSKVQSSQDHVLRICLGMQTENINTQVQLLEIALNLPPKKSIEIVKKSYAWLNQINSWFHPEKYGQLLIHLTGGGYKAEAIELAKKVLVIKPDPRKPTEVDGHIFSHEPVALFDDWHYERVLKKSYSEFVDQVGMDAIKVLLDLIGDYVKLSDAHRKTGSKDDYSEIWRPAIEDHSQNHKYGVRDVLITATRDSCEQFLKSHPDKISSVVKELRSRNLNVLNRLSLHLFRLFPESSKEEIVNSLMNKKEFEADSRLTHEYFLLAGTHGALLNKEKRDQIWSWIMTGADVEKYKKWRQQNGQKYTDEEAQKYVRSWQMYHLVPFSQIDPKWRQYYDSLVKEFGQPKYPSFSSWSEGGSWGPTSGVSEEQLKAMSPSEVVKFLKDWQPPANDPLDHSREGTGRQLTAEVSSNPTKWIGSAPSFATLDPTYVRSYLGGFLEAIKQGKKFEWKPVLDICQVVLEKPINVGGRKASVPFGDDPDWSWCRNTIVDLITEGLSENTGRLSIELRKQVWNVIEVLTNDPDPTPKREEEYLSSSKDDPLTLAINSIRGDAMSAAIQYGVWLKNFEKKENQNEWHLVKYAPELLHVLNAHLDAKKDPSLAIRSVYGEKLGVLAWLDDEWVKNSQYLIFPKEPTEQSYFNASWEAYIIFVHAYNNVFKILQPQYERAVKEVGRHTDAKHHLENPDQRLAHHLIIFYWRGLIDFDKGLLANFYEVANVELRSEIINFIGRVAKDDKEVPQSVKEKFVHLLEDRIEKVKKSKEDVKEFENISWWLASEKFDDNWILDKLLEVLKMGCEVEGEFLIMERFTSVVNQFPLQVVQCLRLMVENDKKEWGTLYLNGELKSILGSALKSADMQAKNATKDLIHRLAARGHLEFKDLLS